MVLSQATIHNNQNIQLEVVSLRTRLQHAERKTERFQAENAVLLQTIRGLEEKLSSLASGGALKQTLQVGQMERDRAAADICSL